MKDIKNKFNLQGIIGDIKSMISPTGNTPNPEPSDALGMQLAKLSVMVQELQAVQLEQAKKLGEVNALFNEVYQSLESLRGTSVSESKSDESATKEEAEAPEKKGADE